MAITAGVASARRRLMCLGAGATWILSLALTLAPVSVARGQVSAIETAETSEGGPEEGEPPRLPTTRLRLTATPAPRGALNNPLLPDYLDLTPGNGAPLYYRAIIAWSGVWSMPGRAESRKEFYKKYEQWRDAPIDKLPLDDMQETLAPLSDMFEELDKAARRDHCDWGLRLREMRGREVISFRLEEFQMSRDLARALELRIRMEVAAGHLDQALHSLQTGFALARDVAKPKTLVNALLGMAISKMMFDQLDAYIGHPRSPNMYWSLTALPDPLIDMRGVLSQERAIPLQLLPILRDPQRPRPLEEWQAEMEDTLESLIEAGGIPSSANGASSHWKSQLALTGFMLKDYPDAKQWLLSQGYSGSEVEAMPTLQAVALHLRDGYDYVWGETFKWLYLPYPEAAPRLRQTEQRLRQEGYFSAGGGLLSLAQMLLPAVEAVAAAKARVQRRVALLRCVEALRRWAFEHDGQWPEDLAAVTQTPLPNDPATGRPFHYVVINGAALLWGEAIGQQSSLRGQRYELALRPANVE